jgi:hypothetical protein
MTLHYVRVFSEPPKGNAQKAVSNWVANYAEWDQRIEDHGFTEVPEHDWLVGGWFFKNEGEEPTDIVTDLSDRLSKFQGGLGHRIIYYTSDHDADNPEECVPVEATESGDVPELVPDIPDEATVV